MAFGYIDTLELALGSLAKLKFPNYTHSAFMAYITLIAFS